MYTFKAYMRVYVLLYALLISELEQREYSAFRPCRFSPEGKAPIRIGQEGGWAPVPVLTLWRKTSLLQPGVESIYLTRPDHGLNDRVANILINVIMQIPSRRKSFRQSENSLPFMKFHKSPYSDKRKRPYHFLTAKTPINISP